MTINVNMSDMRGSFLHVVKFVRNYGDAVVVRDQPTRELINVNLRFVPPLGPMLPLNIGRKVNQKLAAVEALSLIAGSAERDLTMAAAPGYAKVLVSQDKADFYYAAYGPRVGETIETVIRQLVDDETSRQAVLSIWKREDLFHAGDKPCTLNIQFLIRRNALHMIVNMRSNDLWLGLTYDAFVFNQLHWTVLRELRKHYPDLKLGEYHHHAGSMHVYERDFAAIDETKLPSRWGRAVDHYLLPTGIISAPGYFFDQTAQILLHPPADLPSTVERVTEMNPWYAAQMNAIEDTA